MAQEYESLTMKAPLPAITFVGRDVHWHATDSSSEALLAAPVKVQRSCHPQSFATQQASFLILRCPHELSARHAACLGEHARERV